MITKKYLVYRKLPLISLPAYRSLPLKAHQPANKNNYTGYKPSPHLRFLY